MVQTIFFLDVFGWGKRQLYAVCLKAFRAYCSLKYHLYLEKSIAFRYSFEKPVMSQNIASKLAAKRRKLKVLKSWSEALMNSPESTKFFACVQIEIVNNFLCVKVSLCIKICTEILLHVGNYNKLQNNFLRQSLSQVAVLLGDNCIFFLHLACLFLSQWQV